jgi:hypothetical protein
LKNTIKDFGEKGSPSLKGSLIPSKFQGRGALKESKY